MNDQLLIVALSTIITGIFSILSALIPVYLQRNKSTPQLVHGQLYHSWPWYFIFGVIFTLFLQFALLLVYMYGFFAGVIVTAAQTADAINLLDNFDISKSADSMKYLQRIDQYVESIVNGIIVLFVSKFCSHRSGKYALVSVLMIALITTIIDFSIYSWIMDDRALITGTDLLLYFIITLFFSLTGAYFGYLWARNSRTTFLVNYVSKRLCEADRVALLDLALSQPRVNKRHSGDCIDK